VTRVLSVFAPFVLLLLDFAISRLTTQPSVATVHRPKTTLNTTQTRSGHTRRSNPCIRRRTSALYNVTRSPDPYNRFGPQVGVALQFFFASSEEKFHDFLLDVVFRRSKISAPDLDPSGCRVVTVNIDKQPVPTSRCRWPGLMTLHRVCACLSRRRGTMDWAKRRSSKLEMANASEEHTKGTNGQTRVTIVLFSWCVTIFPPSSD